jgi:protein phosphatase
VVDPALHVVPTVPEVEHGKPAKDDRVTIVAAAVSNRGRDRSFYADAYVMLPEVQVLAIVGGVGKDPHAERAARRLVNVVRAEAAQVTPSPMDLVSALDWAGLALRQDARGLAIYTGIVFSKHVAHLAHIGHGRCYRMRGSDLQRLSVDHTFAEQCLRDRIMTATQAARSPVRSLLIRALGAADAQVDATAFEVDPGDTFALVSHGLHAFAADETIAAILEGEHDVERAAVRLALAAGASPFDVTAIVARAVPSNWRER